MMTKIAVARVLKTRGLRGEVKVQTADARPERFTVGSVVLTEEDRMLTIRSVQNQGIYSFLRFHEVETIEQALPLVGRELFVEEGALPAPKEDHYYVKDLLGLAVIDVARGPVGTLDEVMETGANDIYVVRTPEGERVMIPAVHAFIRAVDLDEGVMDVALIEGM